MPKTTATPSASVVEPTQQDSNSAFVTVGAWLAPVAVAVALIGFWVYLGALEILDVAPRTTLTAVYYALVGIVLWPLAWRRRATIAARLLSSTTSRVFTIATVSLFAWLCLDVAIAGRGDLGRRLAAEAVLLTVPAALVVLGMARYELDRLLLAIVAVGSAFALLELAMLWRGPVAGRYTPLIHLDPISAAQYAAIALVALAATRLRAAWAVPLTLTLTLGAVLPGSRGPVAGAVIAVPVVLLLVRRAGRERAALAGAFAIATVASFAIAGAFGTSSHLVSIGGGGPDKGSVEPAGKPITSDAVRAALLRQALERSRDRLLTGNGVGTLADESAVAKRLRLDGCCTYPHNEAVEALYSFGIGGLLLYVAAITAAAVAYVRIGRGAFRLRVDGPAAFFLGFALYAFLQSQISGEIAEDVRIWVAAALGMALLHMRRQVPT